MPYNAYFPDPADPKQEVKVSFPDDIKPGTPEFHDYAFKAFANGDAQPAKKQQGMLDRLSAMASSAYDTVAQPATTGVAYGLQAGPAAWGAIAGLQGEDQIPFSPPQGGAARGIAKAVVPQDLTSAGILAGTALAGGGAAALGARGALGAGMRVAGAVTGGMAGSAAEGLGPIPGGLQGVAGGLLGEAGGALASKGKTLFSKTAALRLQADKDAQALGSIFQDLRPLQNIDPTNPAAIGQGSVFPAPANVEELRSLVKTGGRSQLSQQQDIVMDAINDTLNNLPPDLRKVRSPLDPSKFVPFTTARTELKHLRWSTFDEPKANAANHDMFEADPMKVQNFKDAMTRFREDLDVRDPTGTALALFDRGRQQYQVGTEALNALEQGFPKGEAAKAADRVIYRSDKVMSFLADQEGRLRKELGSDNFDALQYAVMRASGKLGTVDVPKVATPGIATAATLRGNVTAGVTGLANALKAPQLVGQSVNVGLGPTARMFSDLMAETASNAASRRKK